MPVENIAFVSLCFIRSTLQETQGHRVCRCLAVVQSVPFIISVCLHHLNSTSPFASLIDTTVSSNCPLSCVPTFVLLWISCILFILKFFQNCFLQFHQVVSVYVIFLKMSLVSQLNQFWSALLVFALLYFLSSTSSSILSDIHWLFRRRVSSSHSVVGCWLYSFLYVCLHIFYAILITDLYAPLYRLFIILPDVSIFQFHGIILVEYCS